MSVPDFDDIAHHRAMLETYRSTLRYLLRQVAQYNGDTFTPSPTIHQILNARQGIKHSKGALRSWGEHVDDYPDDIDSGEDDRTSPKIRSDYLNWLISQNRY